jgi:uncharacterized membrane protein YccF (DUF307 family)
MTWVLNGVWFIFGGFISALLWLLTAVVLAATIVGLPWAAAALRIAGFSLAPFGRTAISRTGWQGGGGVRDIVLNLVWVVFAGWWLALHHVVIGCLQCLTVIGIPFGLQHFKLAAISLAPVGTEIVPA